jgi:hypothetical protein
MQAIITKYLGPTNSRGARIKAECERGKIFFPFPYELSGDEVHRAAVHALVEKFAAEDVKQYGTPKDKNPWLRPFVTGQIPSGEYVHVFTE